MDDSSALSEQGTTEFPLQVEVEEDLEQEIEAFVRFKRRGQYAKAHELFQEVLTPHIAFFPVVAEYADLLLEEGKYGALSKFLDIQIECMEPVFEEDEVELLRIMRSLALIHTKGALGAALQQASETWKFLQRTEKTVGRSNLPNDVQIHAFEIYIQIIVFAMNTSSWVNDTSLECPWNVQDDLDAGWFRCGFIQWYQALSRQGDYWNASRVLIAVLKILHFLSPDDKSFVFDEFSLGTYGEDEDKLQFLGENRMLTGFIVHLSGAQALMDLALLLRLRRGDGNQQDYVFHDWYLSYIAALKFHKLASKFLFGIQDFEELTLHRLKLEIQDKLLSSFLLYDVHPQNSLDYPTKRMRMFPDWIFPFLSLADTQSVPDEKGNPSCTLDLLERLNIQLHENADLIGCIETCALLHAAAPRAQDKNCSTGSKVDEEEDKSSSLLEVKLDDLVIQTLDVTLWLTGREPNREFDRLIRDTSIGILPFGNSEDTALENVLRSGAENLNHKAEVFDIPLYFLFLHIFRGTYTEALYQRIVTHLPGVFPQIFSNFESTAFAIKSLFQNEIRPERRPEAWDLEPPRLFLTNEILSPSGRGDSSLLSYLSGVNKAYRNAQVACRTLQKITKVSRDPEIRHLMSKLKESLASAEIDIVTRWYDHVFHCGFHCERDSIVRHQMKHILAMLEEILSTQLAPKESYSNQEFEAVQYSVESTHKFMISILDAQRERIKPKFGFDTPSKSDSNMKEDKVPTASVQTPYIPPPPPSRLKSLEAGTVERSSRRSEPSSGRPGDDKADKNERMTLVTDGMTIGFRQPSLSGASIRIGSGDQESMTLHVGQNSAAKDRRQLPKRYVSQLSGDSGRRLPENYVAYEPSAYGQDYYGQRRRSTVYHDDPRTDLFRDLDDVEHLVVDDFERHISIFCMSCDWASKDFRVRFENVCKDGQTLAICLTEFFYCQNGRFFAKHGEGSAGEVDLTGYCVATRSLLRAVHEGLDVHVKLAERTTNAYKTGAPSYPGGNDIHEGHAQLNGTKFKCLMPDCPSSRTLFTLYSTFQRHIESQHFPRYTFYCPINPEPDSEFQVTSCPEFNRRDKMVDHCRRVHLQLEAAVGIEANKVEIPCPVSCPLCSIVVRSWSEFYKCVLKHCIIEDDSADNHQPTSHHNDPGNEGLDVQIKLAERTTNPYDTGEPWYPGGNDRGSTISSSSGIFPYPGRADSSVSRDSGYGSQTGSAYSNAASAYSSLNLLAKSKDKGRKVRSPTRKERRSTHLDDIPDTEYDSLDDEESAFLEPWSAPSVRFPGHQFAPIVPCVNPRPSGLDYLAHLRYQTSQTRSQGGVSEPESSRRWEESSSSIQREKSEGESLPSVRPSS